MAKISSSVTCNDPIVAKVPHFRELHSIKALRSSCGTHALCYLSPQEIQHFLYAPVLKVWDSSTLQQRSRADWSRQLAKNNVLLSEGSLFLPVLISAGQHWSFDGDLIRITGQACIIDGARRLDAMLRKNRGAHFPKIPANVICGLDEEKELAFRRLTQDMANTGLAETLRNFHKVGTDTLRLTIATNWVELSIESDPYVVKTSLGYTAAINVRRKNGGLEHVLCGSKSFSADLEAVRLRRQSLVGLKIRVRKETSDPRAPYEISIVGQE